MNGVEMVKFASRPVGGYLRNGMAKVGVKTSCVPGYNKTKIWLETISRKIISTYYR